MERIIKIFPSTDELTDFFVSRISSQLIAKSRNQYFSFALSGGSTPRAIFKIMAEKYKRKIDWSKVLIFWGDERCVAPSDNESNYRMAYETLLRNITIPDINIFRIKGENNPKEEADSYSKIFNKLIPKINNIPKIDLIMLGLGEDGHTASIFPNNIDLFNSGKLFAVSEHPVTGQKRITATGTLINNAREVCFMVTGSGKAEKVARIIHKNAGWEELPASLVDPVEGQAIWLLDEQAAAGL